VPTITFSPTLETPTICSSYLRERKSHTHNQVKSSGNTQYISDIRYVKYNKIHQHDMY